MYRFVGISGSPVKNSNTHLLLEESLKPLQERNDTEIQLFDAGRMNISDCVHCNHCLIKQTPEKLCSIQDDMETLYRAIIEADALILATPVYFGRLSGYLAKVIDRLRAVHYGKAIPGGMKDKVGAGLTVAWYRHGGLETTLMTLNIAFFTLDMIVAAPGSMGGAAVSSLGGDGTFDPKDKHQVLKDDLGLNVARKTVERAFELVQMVSKAKQA
jgi:multimeric flavodoxin WrbA